MRRFIVMSEDKDIGYGSTFYRDIIEANTPEEAEEKAYTLRHRIEFAEVKKEIV